MRLPPLSTSMSMISFRVAISSLDPATSNTSHVPNPMTGIGSSVAGTGFVSIFSDSEKASSGAIPIVNITPRVSRRLHNLFFMPAPMRSSRHRDACIRDRST